ncbi:unnamed protein product, partial [Symbiodinium microadriaticum]
VTSHFRSMKDSMWAPKDRQGETDSRQQAYPVLKGKAIETMTLSPALAFVFKEHSDGSPFDKMICLALDRCVGIDKLFQEHQHENVFPKAARLDLQRQVLEYLEMQQALQKLSAKKLDRKLFNLTKKAHDLFHIAELASEINPRRIWCMPQEDLMGKVSLLMHSCMTGSSQQHSCNEFQEKYRLALHFELTSAMGRFRALQLGYGTSCPCRFYEEHGSLKRSASAAPIGLLLDQDKCMPGSQPGPSRVSDFSVFLSRCAGLPGGDSFPAGASCAGEEPLAEETPVEIPVTDNSEESSGSTTEESEKPDWGEEEVEVEVEEASEATARDQDFSFCHIEVQQPPKSLFKVEVKKMPQPQKFYEISLKGSDEEAARGQEGGDEEDASAEGEVDLEGEGSLEYASFAPLAKVGAEQQQQQLGESKALAGGYKGWTWQPKEKKETWTDLKPGHSKEDIEFQKWWDDREGGRWGGAASAPEPGPARPFNQKRHDWFMACLERKKKKKEELKKKRDEKGKNKKK